MKSRAHVPYLLVLPTFFLVVLFTAYPLIEVIRLSFTDLFLLIPDSGRFVGLKTYLKVMKDPIFTLVLYNTVKWIVLGTLFSMILGLVIGYFLSFDWRVNRLLRAIIIIPWIVPAVVSAAAWQWMMHGTFGVINDVLMRLHIIHKGIPFLGDPRIALYALVLVLVWKNVPLVAILLSAAFQGVPGELLEAATIDGANSWQKFLRITFPCISDTFLILIIIVTIWCIQQFVIIWVTTQGGPVDASHILPTYIYQTFYENYRFGEAGVLSVVNILLLIAVSLIYLSLFRKER